MRILRHQSQRPFRGATIILLFVAAYSLGSAGGQRRRVRPGDPDEPAWKVFARQAKAVAEASLQEAVTDPELRAFNDFLVSKVAEGLRGMVEPSTGRTGTGFGVIYSGLVWDQGIAPEFQHAIETGPRRWFPHQRTEHSYVENGAMPLLTCPASETAILGQAQQQGLFREFGWPCPGGGSIILSAPSEDGIKLCLVFYLPAVDEDQMYEFDHLGNIVLTTAWRRRVRRVTHALEYCSGRDARLASAAATSKVDLTGFAMCVYGAETVAQATLGRQVARQWWSSQRLKGVACVPGSMVEEVLHQPPGYNLVAPMGSLLVTRVPLPMLRGYLERLYISCVCAFAEYGYTLQLHGFAAAPG